MTFQLFALHLGALAVVQPLLVSGLLFALLLRRWQSHHHVERRQLGWAMMLAAALAAFLVLAAPVPRAGAAAADRLPAIGAAVAGLTLTLALTGLGRRQAFPARAAALLGTAVGVIYAATAALLKTLTNIANHGLVPVLASWQLYCVLAVGAVGLVLNQLTLQAGPIAAGLAATAAVDPLLSIVVGVFVYDEHVSRGPGSGAVLTALVPVLALSVVQLARSTNESEVEDHPVSGIGAITTSGAAKTPRPQTPPP